MTTKLIAVALAIAAITAACRSKSHPAAGAAPGIEPSVQVWPGLGLASAADALKDWHAGWNNGTFLLRDEKLPGHNRIIGTCAGLAGVSEGDVNLTLPWERYNFRERSIHCGVVEALMGARPARVSYIRDVIESNDPGALLPAAVSPVTAPPGATSWRAADPTLTFDRAGGRPGYQELLVGGAFRGRLSWWAAGDFDGDGVEDAALFLNVTPKGATTASSLMRGFLVTRRRPGGPVTVIRQFH